jgi:hypothetical protein
LALAVVSNTCPRRELASPEAFTLSAPSWRLETS